MAYRTDKKKNIPDISIAIITRNEEKRLYNCISSVYKKVVDLSFEIVLVDNNSEDNTISMVNKYFPDVTLIRNNKNRGVAPARNQAIKQCRGEYVLILDADTEIVSDNLSKLIDFINADKAIGIMGCTLVSDDNILHSSTRTFPRPIHVLMRRLSLVGAVKNSKLLKEHHLENWDRNSPMEVDFVEGAFQIIRRSAIQKIGFLDEEMFYGFEDADYCARMKAVNFKTVCYPDFVVKHHLRGVTRGNPFNKMAYFHMKSYIRFYRKHRALIGKSNC